MTEDSANKRELLIKSLQANLRQLEQMADIYEEFGDPDKAIELRTLLTKLRKNMTENEIS